MVLFFQNGLHFLPRKKMFGLYGEASGVRPEACWPDSETIRQYREELFTAYLCFRFSPSPQSCRLIFLALKSKVVEH